MVNTDNTPVILTCRAHLLKNKKGEQQIARVKIAARRMTTVQKPILILLSFVRSSQL